MLAALNAYGGGGDSGPPPPVTYTVGGAVTGLTGSGTVGTANITTVAVACSTLATYTVGGTVTGLTGSGLVLDYYDNVHPAVHLAVPAAGAFTFSAGFTQGSVYQVVVGTEPASPTQNCVVTSGTGVVGTANISDISVACSGVGRFAYAANAGDDTISVYAIDSITGALNVSMFKVDHVTGALSFVTTWIANVDNYLATDRNGEILHGATGGRGRIWHS